MTTKQSSLDGEEEPKKHHWTHDMTPEQRTEWGEKMREARQVKATEEQPTEMAAAPKKKKRKKKRKKKTHAEILGDWEKRAADREANRTLQMITNEMFAKLGFRATEKPQPEPEPEPEPPPNEEEEDPPAPEISPSQPSSPEPEPEPEDLPPEPTPKDVVSPVSDLEGPTTTIAELSPHDRKAEAWFHHQPEEIMFRADCIECHEPMWTWTKGEDMCERCGFELRERRQEFYRIQRRDRTINYDAFGRQNEQAVKVGIDAPEQKKINPNVTPEPRHVPLDPFGQGGRRGITRNPFA